MDKSIEHYFLPLDAQEREQKRTGKFALEFAEEKDQSQTRLVIQNQLFYDSQNIIIRKHRRFAPYPLHSHQFLEFNYMLRGQSQQIINGKPVTLKEKQLLLLDTGSSHEIAALGEQDLLINFLFRTNELNLNVLRKIDSENAGLTYNFLMSAVLESGYHDNFLLLDLNDQPEIQVTIEQMIREFFAQYRLTKEVLDGYAQVLFLQLSRVYHSQMANVYQSVHQADLLINILHSIEDNYQTLTLSELAHELGYNKNYLSNVIKAKTGRTFKELITEQRLNEAHRLILSTNVSIEAVAEHVGYRNKTQFYKKYREYFHATPLEVRKLR